MTDRPVLLLDVDGCINASRAGWHRAPRAVQVWSASDRREYRIRWEPQTVTAINRLHDAGLADVRWCTTWCPDIAYLQEALQIGPFDAAFTERPAHLTWAEMKLNAALAVLDEGRRLVWVDDVEVNAARVLCPQIAVAEKEGKALLIAPNPARGLRPEDVDLIGTYCKMGS